MRISRPKYLDAETTAKLLGCTASNVKKLCQKDKIEGATKIAGMWQIPIEYISGITLNWKRGQS